MKKEKTVTRICRLCKQPFTIITARGDGRFIIYVKGWQNRRYCNNCMPAALYKDHAAYQRYWWHNMRNQDENETADNSV